MQSTAKLVITFTRPGTNKALALAEIDNPALLGFAARCAVQSKRDIARRLTAADATLGAMAEAEAHRLESVLSAVVPEMDHDESRWADDGGVAA